MTKVIVIKERIQKDIPFLRRIFEEISGSTEHVEKVFGTIDDMGIPGDSKCDRSIDIENVKDCLPVPYGWVFLLEP